MKKLLGLLSAGLIAAVMSGCGEKADSVTITINTIGTVVVNAEPTIVTGKIEAGSNLESITIVILSGTDSVSGNFSFPFIGLNQYPGGTKSLELGTNGLNLSISTAVASPGTYTLKITASDGSTTSSSSKDFTVTNGTPVTESSTLTLGAQDTTLPSLLDADSMQIYSNENTSAGDQARTDVIFSFSSTLTALAFTSPDVETEIPYTTWTSAPPCEYKHVLAAWSDITSQEAINYLWGSGSGSSRLEIHQGDIFIIKTSEGVYKAVQITAVYGTDTHATIDIKGKY
jgi:hypothetical protein